MAQETIARRCGANWDMDEGECDEPVTDVVFQGGDGVEPIGFDCCARHAADCAVAWPTCPTPFAAIVRPCHECGADTGDEAEPTCSACMAMLERAWDAADEARS